MKWVILALLFLISCAPAAQEVVTKPKMEQQAQPAEQPKPQPVLEPQVKAPQQVVAPEPAKPPAPAPAPKPQLTPLEECVQDCEEKCAATAQNSCTQKERSQCKGMCDDNPVVDPAACSQACAYINQPNVCKQQMDQFCSANCVGYCH